MPAETAREFEALEAQARTLMTTFIKAGHEAVAPAIIQPADIYLDVIGESVRARTYVFTDPDGDELCLRPDLTVPTCRLHIERHTAAEQKAKYCYNGAAFRFQPSGRDATHPREFRQAGIESFGAADHEKADAATLALVIEAVKAAGLGNFKLRIGDLGLFRALLAAADMPERWRKRLLHQFWRPEAFRTELKRLTVAPAGLAGSLPGRLIALIDPSKPQDAPRLLAKHMEENGIDLVGARTLAEITENLLVVAADVRAEPLSARTAQLLENYVGVVAPARAAGARLKDVVRSEGVDISAALDAYHRRLHLLAEMGVDVVHADFSAEFGRSLEYYTGFVFEIVSPELGQGSPLAGGGRYDGLLKMCGAASDQPAVGAAIHTERLLAAKRL
ncbi:MAG: ATP phosphoribosyltransferase regulatory subunit [Hyphomicrobiaceae bacterium]|nr:ATP phosphoribosyltransferase regulatory subunit [Hyphomicrobiaceae bacterium]